jgi:hypothetical protein
MLPRTVTQILFCLFFVFVACSEQQEPNATLKDGESGEVTAASAMARRNLITISFTKWGDVIAVDTGLASAEVKDGRCRFSKPLKADESTQWNPFQIYWVIFDSQADVRNGRELSGVFTEDESHKADAVTRADGARPHGFSYLTERAAGFVNLSPVTMHDDDAMLQTVLDVAGHKAAIKGYAEMVDGACKTRTEACRGGTECFENGTFAPLGNIHVVQNMVGMPRTVEQEPTNRIAHGK